MSRGRFPGTLGRALGIPVALLSGLWLGTAGAGPYDPKPTPPYGAVNYGDTKKAYSGAVLTSPNAFEAKSRDYGDQGRGPFWKRDGSPRNCVTSSYDGIRYTRCDPLRATPATKPGLTTGPTLPLAPGVATVHRPFPPRPTD